MPIVAAAQSVEPIRYNLSFPAPHTHYVEVSATVPTAGQSEIQLMLAVWTPGSYLVREFARHIENVTAQTNKGQTLEIHKVSKNRWRVSTGKTSHVVVKYRVYGREMSVRTNWIETSFALLNGAPTFMTLADGKPRPHEVAIELANGWTQAMTGLEEIPGVVHQFYAQDFDTLVDSPILLGNPTVHSFIVDGKPHYLVNEGEVDLFDGAKAARDLELLVQEHFQLWGFLPYEKYLFLNVITESRGGLEHKNSSVLMTSRWATRTRKSYLAWLELASHEIFHAWNVKRLRPVELGPFNYEREVFTKSLWVAEGFTSYYDALLVHRAGLSTREEYLQTLSNQIEALQTTPGRLIQSVEMASQDAWIKYYRPDENSSNTSISYYIKGAVIAFVLDAKIRLATKGNRSLDDVLRAAYEQYADGSGYSPREFQAVVEQVANLDLSVFWNSVVEGISEIKYDEAHETFGLQFQPVPELSPEAPGKSWLGVTVRNDGGNLIVTRVLRDTPAYNAGVNVDDEILAIDEFRVRTEQLNNRLEEYHPGETISLLVARRGQLMRHNVMLGVEPVKQWILEVAPAVSEVQKERLATWLHAVPTVSAPQETD